MAPRTACGAWSGGRGGDWGNDTKPSIQGFGSSFWGSVLPPPRYRPTLTLAHQGSLVLGPASGHFCARPFHVPCSDQAIELFLATGEPWLEHGGELVARPTSPPVISRPALSNTVLLPSCQEAVRKVLPRKCFSAACGFRYKAHPRPLHFMTNTGSNSTRLLGSSSCSYVPAHSGFCG